MCLYSSVFRGCFGFDAKNGVILQGAERFKFRPGRELKNFQILGFSLRAMNGFD